MKRLVRAASIFMAAVACLWPGVPAHADAPGDAAAAVHRLMAANRAQDPAAFLAALADDYQYNGVRKADIQPFGFLAILPDRQLYRVTHLSESVSGVATAIVDIDFTGRFNLEMIQLGTPSVTGHSRLWVEVRRQPAGDWKVSAVRPIRVQFRHADTPLTWIEGMRVNGLTSLRVPPGAALRAEGRTLFGIRQIVSIGASSANLTLDLQTNAGAFERWSAELSAPTAPGRYYVDSVAVILLPRPDGSGLYLAWNQVTVPVIVQ
jgi:hypothetical protein